MTDPAESRGGDAPMELHTVECRWFVPGALPDDVRLWYLDVRPWARASGLADPAWPEEARTDRYAQLGREDLGIKLRGSGERATLDVKPRVGDVRLLVLGPDAVDGVPVARMAAWAKRVYPVGEAPEEVRRTVDPASLVSVRKRRTLRHVRVRGSQTVEVEADVRGAERSMSLELGHVEVDGQARWTLCFEATPADPGAWAYVTHEAEQVLTSFPRRGLLTAEHAMSYPMMLAGRQS